MRLSILCAAALLAIGSVGVAQANLIQNGDFSIATPAQNLPTQMGPTATLGFSATGPNSCTYGGQFVSNWTANSGYGFWYPSATAADTVTSCNQYNSNPTQRLAGVTTAPGPNGTFVGLDGQTAIAASISQGLSLVKGVSYTLTFWWGATEELSFQCSPGLPDNCLTENLQVSVGGASHTYTIANYEQHSFTGWQKESFTFTADSDNPMLTFLSTGTPALPPFAVLTGVSMTRSVPEPPGLALFGAGLLGLGLLTVAARRRALRRDDKGDIA